MSKLTFSYEKDKDKLLSPHINVGELRSHVNGKVKTDEIITYTELIDKTETLTSVLGADYLIITSAYRNKETDIAVGGSGKGMHVEGKALDVIFYKNNKPIDTKLVSCKAQDVGFTGIARISNTATHLDIRTGKKYYGDETKGYNTVTDDFYKYYNIKKEEKKYRKEVKDRFGFDDSTIEFFEGHSYPEDLFYKLAKKGY